MDVVQEAASECEEESREAARLVPYALLPHLMSKLQLVTCISRCFILQPSLSRNKMLMMNDHSLRGVIHGGSSFSDSSAIK